MQFNAGTSSLFNAEVLTLPTRVTNHSQDTSVPSENLNCREPCLLKTNTTVRRNRKKYIYKKGSSLIGEKILAFSIPVIYVSI